MTTIETHEEIRDAVGRLRRDLPGSCRREPDEGRAYPMVHEAIRRREADESEGGEANRAERPAAEERDVERRFRETRLHRVAPISTDLIPSHLAEHAFGLPRSD